MHRSSVGPGSQPKHERIRRLRMRVIKHCGWPAGTRAPPSAHRRSLHIDSSPWIAHPAQCGDGMAWSSERCATGATDRGPRGRPRLASHARARWLEPATPTSEGPLRRAFLLLGHPTAFSLRPSWKRGGSGCIALCAEWRRCGPLGVGRSRPPSRYVPERCLNFSRKMKCCASTDECARTSQMTTTQ